MSKRAQPWVRDVVVFAAFALFNFVLVWAGMVIFLSCG
jgi:hypothetical protein